MPLPFCLGLAFLPERVYVCVCVFECGWVWVCVVCADGGLPAPAGHMRLLYRILSIADATADVGV